MVSSYLHQGLQILSFPESFQQKGLNINFIYFIIRIFLNQAILHVSAITAILGEAYKLINFLLFVSLQSPRVIVTHLFSGRAGVRRCVTALLKTLLNKGRKINRQSEISGFLPRCSRVLGSSLLSHNIGW